MCPRVGVKLSARGQIRGVAGTHDARWHVHSTVLVSPARHVAVRAQDVTTRLAAMGARIALLMAVVVPRLSAAG